MKGLILNKTRYTFSTELTWKKGSQSAGEQRVWENVGVGVGVETWEWGWVEQEVSGPQ